MKKILLLIIAAVFICAGARAGELRVVSLAPSITEILFAIGLGEREIVGVADYSDYPEAAKKIPRVGSLATVNIERIVALRPDYIFNVGSENSPINSRLKAAGLNVTIFDPETIDDIFSNIQKIGDILEKGKNAKETIANMKNRLNTLKAKTEKMANKKKIYMEIWDDPITSCGRGSLQDEVMRLAGAINIAGKVPILYPALSQEFIIKENPDFIIIGYMSRDQEESIRRLSRRFGWGAIKAVNDKNIIADINPSIFLKPGPRIVDGVEEIYRRIYE